MIYIILTIFLFLSLLVGFQFFLVRKSKKIKGSQINPNYLSNEIKKAVMKDQSMLYFYSPSCGACRSQTPVIEKLKKEFKNVLSIDVSRDFRTARVFGIMGTPSIVILNKGTVKEIFIGAKDENILRNSYLKV